MSLNNPVYWIWLQQVFGAGSQKPLLAAEKFGGPAGVYDASEYDRRLTDLFSANDLARMAAQDLTRAEFAVKSCARIGYRIVTPDDAGYPRRLRRIDSPPAALYIHGLLPDVDDEVLVAIVGTRSATPFGLKAASLLASRLAKAGAVVVSGGALGVDSASHKGALQAGGRTVAVLGCGLDYPYLRENEDLRKVIARNGALVSEHPPGAAPTKQCFPIRNRLISGLCLGTVIIEASAKSGSLITANLALEQGRDVFVVPGNALSPAYTGSNRLLHDGAKPVFSALDVLEEYASQYPHRLDLRRADVPLGDREPRLEEFALPPKMITKLAKAQDKDYPPPAAKKITPSAAEKSTEPRSFTPPPDTLSAHAKALLGGFVAPAMQLDALLRASGLAVSDGMRAVTELEFAGVLETLPGRMVRRI